MNLKGASCQLKLVLKQKNNQQTLASNAIGSKINNIRSSQLDQHQHSSILSQIVDQYIKQSTDFFCMMDEALIKYQQKKVKQKEFSRSKSCKIKNDDSIISRKKTLCHSQVDIRSKIEIIKQSKFNSQQLRLKGKKVKQSPSPKRSETLHKFDFRMALKKRSLTAKKSRDTSKKSIQLNDIKTLTKRSEISSFNFTQYQKVYIKRIKNFLDFIYKINFSNRVYIDLTLHSVDAPIYKYRVFIGNGNNHQLFKELLKRRFWYDITTNEEQCHFYWTQYALVKKHNQQLSSIKAKSENKFQFKPKERPKTTKSHTLIKKPVRENQGQLKNKNLNFLSKQEAEVVEEMITQNGHTQFTLPFKFISLTNHIPGTRALSSKKSLLANIKKYYIDVLQEDPFTIIPKSFHIDNLDSFDMGFFRHAVSLSPKKIWMLKPADNSSQNIGVEILPGQQIEKRIKDRWQEEQQSGSFIIQAYIQNPLLYYNRKIDIRHYMLLTSVNGRLKAFWYRQGYVRTCSEVFQFVTKINCRNPLAKKYKNQFAEQQSTWLKNKYIHITNDVVQRQSQNYGKHQKGNKLSYTDLQKYFDYSYGQYPFYGKIIPKMKQIAKIALQSVKGQIDPERKSCNFELFGLDYILDEDFNVWLLDIKSNPSFQNNSPVLDRVIPGLLQQTLRFVVDPLFPPRNHFPAKQRHSILPDPLEGIKFQLFYEE